jgi:choline monooxygenase
MGDARGPMIDNDIASARTLPASFYRDATVFERVRERVFARSWQQVDSAGLAAKPGAVAPFEFLQGCVDEPLLLSRDVRGTLRCLSNVCIHRGNLLCTEAGEPGGLRCHYHGRRFTLDGKMIAMPEFEGVHDFPTARDDLKEVELGTLGPLLFAGFDPAFPFAEWSAPVRERIDFLGRLVPEPSGSRAYDVQASWALYCDNFLEGFHVPFVHPDLAKSIDFGTYRTELFPSGCVQIAEANDPADAFDSGKVAAYYFFLFPNTLLNFYPWGLSLNVVVPLAVDRTRVLYRTFVRDASRRDRGAGGSLDRVELEDEQIIEQVQRGIRSRLYDRGRYSVEREQGLHHFHRLLTRALD